jgi:hypothetical protein
MDDDKDQFIDDDDSNNYGDNGAVDVDQNTKADDSAPATSSSSSPLPSTSDPPEEAVSSSSFSELMPPPSQHDYYALSSPASSPTLLRSLPKDLNTSFPMTLDETVVVGADMEDLDEEDVVDSDIFPEPLPNNGLVTLRPSTTATIKPTHRPPRPLRITHYHKSRTASGPLYGSHPPSKPPLHPQQQQLVGTNPAPLLVTDDPTLLVDVSGLVIHSTNDMDTTATSTSVFNDSILVDLVPGTSNRPWVAASAPTAKVTSIPTPWTSPIAPQLLAELSLAESVSSGLLTDDDDDSTNDHQQLMTTTFQDSENRSFLLLDDGDDNNDDEEADSPPARIPVENGHVVDTTPALSGVGLTATSIHTPSSTIVQMQDIDGVLETLAREDCDHPVAEEEDKDHTTTAITTTPINEKNDYQDLEGRPSRDTQSTHPMDGR